MVFIKGSSLYKSRLPKCRRNRTFSSNANQLFSGISIEKLQKTHVRDHVRESYVSWKKKHCKEGHYALQIKKGIDPTCYNPTKLKQEE